MTSRNDRNWLPFAVVLLLLAAFAIVSRSAALTKSATREETLHAAAGWSYVYGHDWRANMEEPPLPKLVSALPHDPLDLAHSLKSMSWRAILANPRFERDWAVSAVFRSPLIEGDRVVQRARLPMLAFAIALGGLVAWWSWSVGGPGAAIPALLLFCLSPDFIGHAPLVNGDVALAFAWLAVAVTAWSLGERLTLARVALLTLAVSCAALVSFRGLLAIPLAAALLALRASEDRPWPAARTELARPATRWGAAIGLLFATVVACWALTWCGYGLRLSVTASEQPLDLRAALTRHAEARLRAADPSRSYPSDEEIASFPHGSAVRFAEFSQQHSLLPEAWNFGLIAYETAKTQRVSYLGGRVSPGGDALYFPVAFLVKQPVAAIAAFFLAGLLGLRWIRRKEIDPSRHAWLLTCLVLPPAIWGVVTVASNASVGMRQFFPMMPFFFIATGLVAAKATALHGRPARRIVAGLTLVLAAECAFAWPHYIAFFNAAAGGARGGLRILGDSSLDWGQDLKLLAAWQAKHPKEKLYLCYYGTADPLSYGIRYANAFGGYAFGAPREPLTDPGVLAISATYLQGIYTRPDLEPMREQLRKRKPMEVLGGTIYLYRFEGR